MWIEKSPRPYGFCGQVGCPVCYDWAEEDWVVDGFTKAVEDITGNDVEDVAAEEKSQIFEGLLAVHNRIGIFKPSPSAKDTVEEYWTRRSVESFLRQKAREKAVVKPKVDLRPTLDEIADGAKVVEKKVEELGTPEAPIDYDLLRRERTPTLRQIEEIYAAIKKKSDGL